MAQRVLVDARNVPVRNLLVDTTNLATRGGAGASVKTSGAAVSLASASSSASASSASWSETYSSSSASSSAPARYPDSLLAARAARCFTLSDFTIPRKGGHIGSGRFGQVLRVVENSSRRPLVLKRVSKQALVDEGAVRQFQREVEIHSRVRHPNVIRMYAYFHDTESCKCGGARNAKLETLRESAFCYRR